MRRVLASLATGRAAAALLAAAWAGCFLYVGSIDVLPDVAGLTAEELSPPGHFLGGLVFAALALLAAGGRVRVAVPLVLSGALALAAGVELMQRSLPGRTVSAGDLALGLAGALAGAGVVLLARRSGRSRALVTGCVELAAVALGALLLVPVLVLAPELPETVDCAAAPSAPAAAASGGGAPVVDYRLAAASGLSVRDRGRGRPLDLTIVGDGPETPRPDGFGLSFSGGSGRALSDGPAEKLSDALRAAQAFTIQALVRLDRVDQAGPARIVTVSAGPAPHEVNLHLGVEGDALSVRIRTVCEYFNWVRVPGVFREAAVPVEVAVAYAGGRGTVYADGRRAGGFRLAPGGFANWDGSYRLALGNEVDGSRPLAGSIRRVRIWDAPRRPAGSPSSEAG